MHRCSYSLYEHVHFHANVLDAAAETAGFTGRRDRLVSLHSGGIGLVAVGHDRQLTSCRDPCKSQAIQNGIHVTTKPATMALETGCSECPPKSAAQQILYPSLWAVKRIYVTTSLGCPP